jgi:hypothetical protein
MGTGVYCGGCGQRTGGAQGGSQQPQQPQFQQQQFQQPQYQQPQYQQPQFQQYAVNSTKTNGLAIAAFVMSLLCCNVLAVIFGHIAISQINRTGEGGKGLATAALIIGYLSIIGGFFFFVAGISSSGY